MVYPLPSVLYVVAIKSLPYALRYFLRGLAFLLSTAISPSVKVTVYDNDVTIF